MEDIRNRGSTLCHSYTTSAWLRAAVRHQAASPANAACCAGAGHSAAARSKCVAASLSSAAERGPDSQPTQFPRSTIARIWLAASSSGAALTTLADSTLSPSSFHHSGLATSAHAFCVSMLRANAVARPQGLEPTESLRGLRVVPRADEHGTEVEVRCGRVGLQGDCLAVDPGCSAPVLLRAVPDALSHQLIVRVARLSGVPGCLLRNLAMPLLRHPAILSHLPVPLHLLVIHRVPLPSAR
eukprot:scaffold22445_cov73-Phaeocystis_antarctica.AAC.10